MTKKERQTLFIILGINPDTEEQAGQAQARLETEAKRIKLWLRQPRRPPDPVPWASKVNLD